MIEDLLDGYTVLAIKLIDGPYCGAMFSQKSMFNTRTKDRDPGTLLGKIQLNTNIVSFVCRPNSPSKTYALYEHSGRVDGQDLFQFVKELATT